MPRATRADTLARCPRIPGEEVSCRVAGECSAEQDGAVLAAVAAVEGVQAEPPQLKASLKYVLAMGNHHPVVKLDYGIGEIRIR